MTRDQGRGKGGDIPLWYGGPGHQTKKKEKRGKKGKKKVNKEREEKEKKTEKKLEEN